MRTARRIEIALLCICAAIGGRSSAWSEETDRSLPMGMVNFRFTDTYGHVYEPRDFADRKLIVLFNQLNGCPIVRQSFPYMEELRRKYEPQGVAFLYFNSSDYDGDADINHEVDDYKVSVPIVKDWGQALAHALEVERSAECFAVNPADWRIIYRGMADDRFDYGLQRSNPQKFWLVDAIEAHLAQKAPAIRKTIAKGCLLDLDLPSEVAYASDVAKILNAKLPGCAPEGKESWSMLTDDEAKTYAKLIRGILLMRRPPEGSVCAAAGKDVELTPSEIRTVLAWYYSVKPHSAWFNSDE